MFSRCISLSGASRVTRISLRRSLSVTSAARVIRLSLKPIRIALNVFMLHGHTTIPSVRNDPLEILAARSLAL
nr:hypothetical protein CPGR_00605 [Mycolicibacter nonchromogenicus]